MTWRKSYYKVQLVFSRYEVNNSFPYGKYAGYRNIGMSNANTNESLGRDQWWIAENQWRIQTKHRRKPIRRPWVTTSSELWSFLWRNVKDSGAGILQSAWSPGRLTFTRANNRRHCIIQQSKFVFLIRISEQTTITYMSSPFWEITMRRFVVTDVSIRSSGPIFKSKAVSFTLGPEWPETTQ